MSSNVEKLLFPLLVANITTSANLWSILGIGIGQTIFWVTIAMAYAIAINTPYRVIATALLVAFLGLRGAEIFTSSELVGALKVASLGAIYAIAGARIYGRNPALLQKQLIVFFALCIPIMLLQIGGASSFFMGWNTEYAHDLTILDTSEIGTFKVIPVYPTLFVGMDNLVYAIGQGRPVGLLYSNNVLSVFISIAVALNIALAKDSRSRWSDVVVSAALVLSMSFTALGAAIMIYAGYALLGAKWRRIRVAKLFSITGLFLGLYWFLFPGLFLSAFSDAKLWSSLLTRGLDLANIFGWSAVGDLFTDQRLLVGSAFSEESSYSFYSIILKSEVAVPAAIAFLVLLTVYSRQVLLMRKMGDARYSLCAVLAIACLLTQFGVPYVKGPLFQLILGLAFFPLFRKFWVDDANARVAQ